MSGILSRNSVYTGPGTLWVNEFNIDMNHAPGAGSIALPIDL